MAQYGMLRDYRFTEAAEDIRGASLYGRDDEKLGKIDDVIFEHASGSIRYVVVDTGGWLSTKKFIVPADRIRASAEHKDDFASDLTKEQVEAFPPYNEKDLESDEQWGDYEGRYRSKWATGPVMHREATDRNITPTTEQLVGNQASERAAEAASGGGFTTSRAGRDFSGSSGLRSSNESIDASIDGTDTDALTAGGFAASTDTVEISQSANGIGPRWDTFQDRLRQRRKEVIDTGSTGETSKDYRKAS